MANKTILVAQREYLENIRTKTFWIGILAFPVLIAISLGAGFVLNKLKQTQNYAVVDLSEDKIGPEIERQARSPDIVALARLLAKGEGLGEQLAAMQRELGGDLATLKPTTGPDGKETVPEVPEAVRARVYELMMKLPANVVEQMVK